MPEGAGEVLIIGAGEVSEGAGEVLIIGAGEVSEGIPRCW